MSDNEEYTDVDEAEEIVTARWFGEGDNDYVKLVVSKDALHKHGSDKVDDLFIDIVEATND